MRILITGSTDGIGKAIAESIILQGHEVVIHGTNLEKGKLFQNEMKKKYSIKDLDIIIANFSNIANVKAFAKEMKNNYKSLNVLINNAGMQNVSKIYTDDKIEKTFFVNFLTGDILTRELTELLIQSTKNGPSRIVFTSSLWHKHATFNLKDVNFEERNYSWVSSYAFSKLCQIMFCYYFSTLIDKDYLTINSYDPWYVKTNLPREISWQKKLLCIMPFRSPKKGAETGVYLALAEKVKEVTGKYFRDKKVIKSSPISYNHSLQKQLYDYSTFLTRTWELDERSPDLLDKEIIHYL